MIKRIIVGELETNCYIISSEKEIVVIDPGGDLEKIINEISKIDGFVKYIINTHSHSDHTLCNEDLKKETKGLLKKVEDNEEIKIGNLSLKVISSPGHSKDSICLLGDSFIFTGDTIFKNGYGRTDLPGGSEEELIKSLEKISKLLKKGMMIYPGHGDYFQIN